VGDLQGRKAEEVDHRDGGTGLEEGREKRPKNVSFRGDGYFARGGDYI